MKVFIPGQYYVSVIVLLVLSLILSAITTNLANHPPGAFPKIVRRVRIYIAYIYNKLSPKNKCKNSKLRQFSLLCFFFCWVLCTTFSEGHRALHFEKSFKCVHFLFTFGLVYHFAYFVQNTTLSCWQAIYESLVLKSA